VLQIGPDDVAGLKHDIPLVFRYDMLVLAFGTQALYSALLSQGADVLQVPFFENSVARGVWETRVQRVLCSQSIKKAQC
jgi:hypothetical protein